MVEKGRIGGAIEEEDAVAEDEGFACVQSVGSAGGLGGFKVAASEGVGGEEAVVAGVPPSGVGVVSGVVEDGDPDGLAFDGAGVGDPAGAFAPSLGVGVAFGVDDLAFGLGAGELEFGADADAEGAFFGVAEDESGLGGGDGGGEVDGAEGFGGSEAVVEGYVGEGSLGVVEFAF